MFTVTGRLVASAGQDRFAVERVEYTDEADPLSDFVVLQLRLDHASVIEVLKSGHSGDGLWSIDFFRPDSSPFLDGQGARLWASALVAAAGLADQANREGWK